MDRAVNPIIPILIELDPYTYDALDDVARGIVVERLTLQVTTLMSQVGLPGSPTIDMRVEATVPVVRLFVHGVEQRILRRSIGRAWWALAPAGLVDPLKGEGWPLTYGLTADWLRQDPSAQIQADAQVLADFIVSLVMEVIRERLGCLMGPEVVNAYLRSGDSEHTASGSVIGPGHNEIQDILASLLDFGISIANRSAIIEDVELDHVATHSLVDTTESLIARLCADQIEILVHPHYLEELKKELENFNVTGSNGSTGYSIQDELTSLQHRLVQRLGVLLPRITWSTSTDMPPETIAVKVNDLIGIPMSMLQPGYLVIPESAERLQAIGVDMYTIPLSIYGIDYAIASDLYQSAIQEGGLAGRTPLNFARDMISDEIERMAHQMITVDDVEYLLACHEQDVPALIDAVMERFSTVDVTRVLRILLDDGHSIRDLHTLLEHLLQFDTLPIDPLDYVVLDDRLPVAPDVPVTRDAGYAQYANYIRRNTA